MEGWEISTRALSWRRTQLLTDPLQRLCFSVDFIGLVIARRFPVTIEKRLRCSLERRNSGVNHPGSSSFRHITKDAARLKICEWPSPILPKAICRQKANAYISS